MAEESNSDILANTEADAKNQDLPAMEQNVQKDSTEKHSDNSIKGEGAEVVIDGSEIHIDGEEIIEERDHNDNEEPAVDVGVTESVLLANELNQVEISWPDITSMSGEIRTNFPVTYTRNNNKEKLLLLYVWNFNGQYRNLYPDRQPLMLTCLNECHVEKMVSTTIRPTKLPFTQIDSWQECSRFVADYLNYEPLKNLTIIPQRLYSPHTTFLRQSGHIFEISTALCSLLIGFGYEAYVVSGYAIRDITHKIMCRVKCPIAPSQASELFLVKKSKNRAKDDNEKDVVSITKSEKYKVPPAKTFESQFLAMMKQREIDKEQDELKRLEEVERLKMLEEEKRPPDALAGRRVHSWILLGTRGRDVEESVFIEPTTGLSYPLDTDVYSGIESLWSDANYWVNLQDCSNGIASLNYDLSNTSDWEHFLIGEPIEFRKTKKDDEIAGEEEGEVEEDVYDEKHLDMPYPWSMKIQISSESLQRRFPDGSKTTQYLRTYVEEYAPYELDNGLTQKIVHYKDFNCTTMETIEERYENRHDKLVTTFFDAKTNLVIEHYTSGREDGAISHIYNKDDDAGITASRTIYFNSKARYGGLSKIEINGDVWTEYYMDREDKMFYRQTHYGAIGDDGGEMSRRPIKKVLQKFDRNEAKRADDDISVREFDLQTREIDLKYHYAKDCITSSTRHFIKPPISEMGSNMVFHPELTSGYQAQIGVKPLRQLQLFLLLKQQLKDEKELIDNIRDFENEILEFFLLRSREMAFPKLDVSLYNRKQNEHYRKEMMEAEEAQRMQKEKEVEEEEIDYVAPYLARLLGAGAGGGDGSHLTYQQALDVKTQCLEEFRKLLVNRANDIQRQFDATSNKMEEMQLWYTQHHEYLTAEEDADYFQQMNEKISYLRLLEMRLARHKSLSFLRYEAMLTYLKNHPMLTILGE